MKTVNINNASNPDESINVVLLTFNQGYRKCVHYYFYASIDDQRNQKIYLRGGGLFRSRKCAQYLKRHIHENVKNVRNKSFLRIPTKNHCLVP